MAYNNYYSGYQPMMGYPYQQQIQPNYNYQQQAYPQAQMQMAAQNQQQAQMQQPQIQNGGFIQVHNEDEARNYPIAPGNSVTFKDENAPYVYTKTMGFSQLDRPIFEKYRLVKEDDIQAAQNQPVSVANNQTANMIDYALKADLTALQADFSAEIEALKQRIEELTVKKPATKAKKESDAE